MDQPAAVNAAGRSVIADPLGRSSGQQQANPMFAQPMDSLQQVVPFEADEFAAAGQIVQSAAPASGLLSIDFQIPSDGTRHDFVRTGGNAEMTLTVRDRGTIHFGFGILWSIACLIVAVILLKGVSKGSLLLRICLLASVVGLAGWLCVPGDIRYAALALCIAATVCFCVGMAKGSLRRTAAAN